MSLIISRQYTQNFTRHVFRRSSTALQEDACMSIAAAYRTSCRTFLVRFHDTPNEACCKFSVDGVVFLPEDRRDGMLLRFDLDNCFQSPLAEGILQGLPMVEEVTIGPNFVTVRRVDDDDAEAAARYYAQKIGKMHSTPPGEAAERSAALQQRVVDAMYDESADRTLTVSSSSSPDNSKSFMHVENPRKQEEKEKEKGEMTETEEQVDKNALRDLLLSTHWSELKLHVSALLTDHLFSGRPHIDPDAPHPHPDTLPKDGDSEVVLMLKELIARTIRPQLQLDGGDIRFISLEGNVMYVEMLGACRKCKSSKTTLRDLIERTTRHWIPEVHEVREVEKGKSPHEDFVPR